jgi:hypothetical protein
MTASRLLGMDIAIHTEPGRPPSLLQDHPYRVVSPTSVVSTPRRPAGTAVGPRPTHAGNEKHLGGFWIVEACDLDMALKLAAEGPCQRLADLAVRARVRSSRESSRSVRK